MIAATGTHSMWWYMMAVILSATVIPQPNQKREGKINWIAQNLPLYNTHTFPQVHIQSPSNWSDKKRYINQKCWRKQRDILLWIAIVLS